MPDEAIALKQSEQLMAPTVINDGRYWRLIIEPNAAGKHLVHKEISNQVKPDILTTVDIDIATKDDGTKEMNTSLSEVRYPKYKYSKSEIEKVAAEIAAKNVEADCPLCQKMKAALSVEEEKLPLGLDTLQGVMPELPELFEPFGMAFEDFGKAIADMLKSPFDASSRQQTVEK
jgi:hypothetical protein